MEFKEAPKSWRERRKKESCPIGKAMMHLGWGKRRKADWMEWIWLEIRKRNIQVYSICYFYEKQNPVQENLVFSW